jgi:hypothetical protein
MASAANESCIEILAPPAAPRPSSKACLISPAPPFFTVYWWRRFFSACGFTMIGAITVDSNASAGRRRFIASAAINFTPRVWGLSYALAHVARMKIRA